MKAVIELSGKQFLVAEGSRFKCEDLHLDDNATMNLDKVVMTVDGEKCHIGAPYVKGSVVTLRALRTFKDKKVIVYKFHKHINYRRKKGHRQIQTEVLVEKIQG